MQLTAAKAILIILGGLLSPAIVNNWLKVLGIQLNPADVQNGVAGTEAKQYVPAGTSGAVVEEIKKATTAQTVNDAVNKPLSLFGIAAIGFVGVFVIAQLRAASHEAGSAAVDVYNEGKRASGTLANADGTTSNISRRAKS